MAQKKVEPTAPVAANIDYASDLIDAIINHELQSRRLFIEMNGEVKRVKAAFWGRPGTLYLTDTDDYVEPDSTADGSIRKAK